MDNETKVRIFQSAKNELMRHVWDTFVNDPPSVAQGGSGVVIPRCPACHKRLYTVGQFLRSRCSLEGIQIVGKRFSASNVSNNRASRRSCFCLRVSALRIFAG